MSGPTGSLRAALEAKASDLRKQRDLYYAEGRPWKHLRFAAEVLDDLAALAQPAPPTEATEARAVLIHEVVEGPRDCMWRSGHDGTGPDPSRFFCDVVGPPPSCHVYRAVADTEVEARALAFKKADPARTVPTEATPPHDGLREAPPSPGDALAMIEQEIGHWPEGAGRTAATRCRNIVKAMVRGLAALSPSEVQPAPPMTLEEAREVGRIEGLEEAAKVADSLSAAAHKASNDVGHEDFGKFCSLSGKSSGAKIVADALRAILKTGANK